MGKYKANKFIPSGGGGVKPHLHMYMTGDECYGKLLGKMTGTGGRTQDAEFEVRAKNIPSLQIVLDSTIWPGAGTRGQIVSYINKYLGDRKVH
jgi:hypothetical protein